MDRQHDFFREPDPAADDDGIDQGTTQAPPAPLAVPCGFVDRSGKPCRRLAHETVCMNGRPFLHRGGELLHCVAACFRGTPDALVDLDPGEGVDRMSS
ncbi:hypothetical protein ACWGNZ_22995 (plasmid) [Sphingomonas zeae]|jgi:hypothetical protein